MSIFSHLNKIASQRLAKEAHGLEVRLSPTRPQLALTASPERLQGPAAEMVVSPSNVAMEEVEEVNVRRRGRSSQARHDAEYNDADLLLSLAEELPEPAASSVDTFQVRINPTADEICCKKVPSPWQGAPDLRILNVMSSECISFAAGIFLRHRKAPLTSGLVSDLF